MYKSTHASTRKEILSTELSSRKVFASITAPAAAQARHLEKADMLKSPMMAELPAKVSSGTTAKGNTKDCKMFKYEFNVSSPAFPEPK
mmetsp:Transcript_24576/g.37343  ORF Transcript_24576/g.37343 Transcript_24576/m.37343 type:complete len:88 (-) Transcript_24576:435-698(-)